MIVELIRTDVDPAEVIHEIEVADPSEGRALYRYQLQSELYNRDEEGEYTARVRPEPEGEPQP